ncbi:aldehyde dehydrogenase (NADP(+)) [Luteolibacter sp. SL250]|uniref:aldehyde dehydrogenase (NADP(+)) n=1 Tax=Luteolibacter sp. SL250 TaxID=2995170 RepID=UPI002270EECE|nr:aldehyde dehydrogenase (NADP(+)) [Luteolibacter sp. SL250]WAC18163.1 aldehyde dehydrogenase (NADP(+)) [Luteolibacter sp. SL250]
MASSFHGGSLIAGKHLPPTAGGFTVFSPITLEDLPGEFFPASAEDVENAMTAARDAFRTFRTSSGEIRAGFLEAIAENLTTMRDILLERARLETGLPIPRLQSELDRTTGHLRMFAAIARDGSWLDLRHEPPLPDRKPSPRPDLKRVFRPIGPVVVFGSSNFPLAYSVAGGDTASALATGNPVVVKAHEAHPGTSELVAGAINAAVTEAGLPAGVFSMLQGSGKELGIPLVTHPATRAVGFTGSTHVGRIFIDAAAKRPDPIPVFAEMGSLNPVVILPSALDGDPEHIARLLASSITTDAGQFCTKPGIILVPDGSKSRHFLDLISAEVASIRPVPMLHRGIHSAFVEGSGKLRALSSVSVIACKEATPDSLEGSIQILRTDAESFLAESLLRQEYFGPLSIFVTWSGLGQIQHILHVLGGQLTATLFTADNDPEAVELIPLLEETAGRVILNGVPTGVEVNSAIQHGGPWPACSDSRFSAVGPSALLRFVRPVAYQNFPAGLLPDFNG